VVLYPALRSSIAYVYLLLAALLVAIVVTNQSINLYMLYHVVLDGSGRLVFIGKPHVRWMP